MIVLRRLAIPTITLAAVAGALAAGIFLWSFVQDYFHWPTLPSLSSLLHGLAYGSASL